jgi:hypothetical protein
VLRSSRRCPKSTAMVGAGRRARRRTTGPAARELCKLSLGLARQMVLRRKARQQPANRARHPNALGPPVDGSLVDAEQLGKSSSTADLDRQLTERSRDAHPRSVVDSDGRRPISLAARCSKELGDLWQPQFFGQPLCQQATGRCHSPPCPGPQGVGGDTQEPAKCARPADGRGQFPERPLDRDGTAHDRSASRFHSPFVPHYSDSTRAEARPSPGRSAGPNRPYRVKSAGWTGRGDSWIRSGWTR